MVCKHDLKQSAHIEYYRNQKKQTNYRGNILIAEEKGNTIV